MKKSVVIREFRLRTYCPYCGAKIDLLHEAFDGLYGNLADGRTHSDVVIECPNRVCEKEFGIESIDNY